jgi:hypothetical protein
MGGDGGYEVWRRQRPSLPRKHFYPRQPKVPNEGAAETARMVTVYATASASSVGC